MYGYVLMISFQCPTKKNQILLWPTVHGYMKEKYGVLYKVDHLKIDIVTNLLEDPLGNETGNQVVASGNEEVQQQIV